MHLPASNIHCYYITSFPYFTLYKGDYFTYLRLRVKEKHQRGNYNMQNFHTTLLYVHVQVLFKQKQSCVTTIKQMPARPPTYGDTRNTHLAFGLLRALGILRCYVGVQCSGKQRNTLEISYCKCLPRSYRRLSCHKFRQRIRILEIDRFD